jgi:2-oxoisovalerate dehydrogenase E2 component (dihydrolipoyl transacylase)
VKVRVDLKLPRYGTSMEEGTVGQWHHQAGDLIAKGDPLCEIETEKVAVDFESPVAGTLLEVVAATGTDLEVGSVLCRIEVEMDDPK